MSHKLFLLAALLVLASAFDLADPSQVDNYVFAPFNQTTDIGARSGAVSGSSSDFGTIYVLGGENSQGPLSSNYKFDIAGLKWTALEVNFSRTGACYAQDGNRNGIWVLGGVAYGANNTQPFLTYNFDNTFTVLEAPPASVSLTSASCAALGDGSKFYALFGETAATRLEEFGLVNCSNSVAVYDAAAKKWSALNGTKDIPPARAGASVYIYNNIIVVYGGMCGETYFGDVYRLNLENNEWTKDNSTGTIPTGRSQASVFINLDTLFVYGGLTAAGAVKDAFTYDLVNHVWAPLNTSSAHPEARYAASTVGLVNRGFLYGGQSDDFYYDEAYQLVAETVCLPLGCEDCTGTTGCGWCASSAKCVAGETSSFVATSCNATSNFITDLDSCPQVFPSYGIALLVIGGVVVVGVIIFAIMKVRSGEDRDGYEKIS